jgi:ketosteroid isomerase-like protein
MDRSEVMAWVAEYERAWRAQDADAVGRLFADDASYLRSPYDDPPLQGLAAIRDFWADDTPFSMTASPVAVEGASAVVRVEVRYGGERPQEYRDLWVLDFGADGRAVRFEEWAYWPEKPYTQAPG